MIEPRAVKGEDHCRTRYPDSLVRTVREKYKPGKVSRQMLANRHGVPLSTVTDWVTYRTRMSA